MPNTSSTRTDRSALPASWKASGGGWRRWRRSEAPQSGGRFRDVKPDPRLPRRWRLLHHLMQHLGDGFDLIVMQLDCFGQLGDLFDELAGRRQQTPQPDKGPHDLDVDADGLAEI